MRIPQELAKRIRSGDAVLYAGAGLSAAAGLPGWSELLRRMLEARPDPEIESLIADKEYLLAARELRIRLGPDRFRAVLDRIFLNNGIEPGPVHRLIAKIPFSCILTTNYDKLLELAMPPGTSVYTQFDEDGLGRVRRDRHRAIVKIHGDVERPGTIVLAQDDYRRGLFANDAFRNFMDVMFSTRTVIFLGCSLDDYDLKLILEELNYRLKSGQGPHFALMKTKGMSRIRRENFYQSYGIEVFGDDEIDGHPDIEAFLRALPVTVTVAAPRPQVSEAEAADIRALLEAMGQRIAEEQRGENVYFRGEYKAGAEIRKIATCYTPGDAAVSAFEPLFGAPEGLLLAGGSVPTEVAEAAAAHGIQCYSRAGFVGRLANFDLYVKKLKEDYEKEDIDRYFVPLKIQEEKEGIIAKRAEPLDAFIEKWLATEGRNHLSILGDFGTGKTWFSRRLAYRAALSGGRVPILILLRDYSKAYDIEQVLTDALVNRFGVELAAGFKTLQRLNDEGRLLLLFDGFDEMERKVSDFKTALDNFWQIARLVNPRAKIVLTCRTSFFRHRTEEKDVLERDIIDLSGRKDMEVVHLADFDDGQIQEALRRRSPDQWKRLHDRIRKLHGIDDLAHRPVLLDMITRTLPALADAEQVNLATLYDRYTTDLLERRESESIPPADRRYFVEELAWEMQTQQKKSIPFHEFPARVTAHFKLTKPEAVAFFDRDIRTQAYLIRDDDGNYKFAHFSMQEFFVARRLAEKLARGEGPELPLTDAIARFVHYLLKDSYVYERREEDGMVYVPPGPFIYGAEDENNLRIAWTEGYWIDRAPVTNAQFKEFLRLKGNQEEGGVTWLDFDGSSIQDAKKANHPVTGVSWYGARAYASWAKKRLPSEEEWEKAARGIDGRGYPWGEEFSSKRCNTDESRRRGTSPVGEYGDLGRSAFGCDDMAGNVWEWTDNLDSNLRVLRGGSWGGDRGYARCAVRLRYYPAGRDNSVGFRCSRTAG